LSTDRLKVTEYDMFPVMEDIQIISYQLKANSPVLIFHVLVITYNTDRIGTCASPCLNSSMYIRIQFQDVNKKNILTSCSQNTSRHTKNNPSNWIFKISSIFFKVVLQILFVDHICQMTNFCESQHTGNFFLWIKKIA
jgi:hypothetical protein